MRNIVRLQRSVLAASLAAGLALTAFAPQAQAFTTWSFVYDGFGLDVAATLQETERWSATPIDGTVYGNNRGLHDGIQVSIEPGFATQLGAANPAEVGAVNQALLSGFGAWENDALAFDISLDTPAAAHHEINVYAVPDSHPSFGGGMLYGGMAILDSVFDATRGLTNGNTLAGMAIVWTELYFNIDTLAQARAQVCQNDLDPACSEAENAVAILGLTNLVIHEAGHAIGLGHPHEYLEENLDTDFDPLTAVAVDPNDPFAGLVVSPNTDPSAIMNGTAIPPVGRILASNLLTTLQPDDRSGRDVLYPVGAPVPEPSTALLVGVGLVLLATRRRGERR